MKFCNDCQHFDPTQNANDSGEIQGFCRSRPPIVIIQDNKPRTMFPRIFSHHKGCGDFEA